MVKYGEALNKGLKFSIQPKRWLPLFILNLVFFSVFISILATTPTVLASLAIMNSSQAAFFSIIEYILLFAVLLIIWGLLTIWIHGALVYQGYKEKEYDKSWIVSKNKYPCILGAIIIVAIITGIVGLVQFVGWIFSIIVSLIFFFILQGVMIKNEGVVKTMKSSWNIFNKNPLEVFVMWLVIVIISIIIFFISFLPMLAVVGVSILNILSTGSLFESLPFLLPNFWAFMVSAVILLIGISIATAFSIKAQTEFYLQMTKRFLKR